MFWGLLRWLSVILMVTSAVEAGNLTCLECSSYVDGEENDDCGVWDYLYTENVDHIDCPYGSCYVIKDKLNGTDVAYRGCTSDLKDMPFSLPSAGCYTWKDKDICLCYDNECNLVSAGSSSGKELNAPKKPGEHIKIDCYQCMNYDINGKKYDQCPKDAAITSEFVYIDSCNSSCFIRSFADDDKKVARGCTDSQWGLPDPLPPDGCYDWDGAVWCICSNFDGCNSRSLGQSSGKQLDAHLWDPKNLLNSKEADGLNRCYECINYDEKGNYYKQCPKHQTVHNAFNRVCNGTCFTKSYDEDDRKIARGCTDTQFGLPDPLPPDGCYKWYTEVWCVCSTSRCNGLAIGEPQDIEFDAHLKHEGHGNRLVYHQTPFILCLFSIILTIWLF